MTDISSNLHSGDDGSVTSQTAISTDQSISSEPCRRILTSADIDMWVHSEGYRDYLNFIKQLNDFAKRVHNSVLKSREEIVQPCLVKVVALLDRLSDLLDEIVPFNDDKNQR